MRVAAAQARLYWLDAEARTRKAIVERDEPTERVGPGFLLLGRHVRATALGDGRRSTERGQRTARGNVQAGTSRDQPRVHGSAMPLL